MSRHIHIDADVLNYEVAFAAQKTIYELVQGKKVTTFNSADLAKAHCEANGALDYRHLRKMADDEAAVAAGTAHIRSRLEVLPEKVCVNILREKLGRITGACGSTTYTLHLSGPVNFRDAVGVTKPYKGTRTTPKPTHYGYVKQLLLNDDAISVSEGNEADDEISIAVCKDGGIVATIDKDLNMVPGLHYDWNLGLRYKVGYDLATWFFCMQMLKGDSTDNIPGVPSLGEKKIEAMLAPDGNKVSPSTAWDVVLREYNKGPFKLKDGTITAYPGDYLIEQGQLLWMQREVNERWTPALFVEKYLTNQGT